MPDQDYYREALSDFAYEAASAGAIRHLADLGYTAKQISERLTFPTPYERVRRSLWKYLTETGVILTQEPGSGTDAGRAEYTVEHDRYRRASFRLRTSPEQGTGGVRYRELRYDSRTCGSLAGYLADKCLAAGEERSYVSCDFGRMLRRDRERLEASLAVLNERQREYMTGLMWEDRRCYHRLDGRMREIIVKLYSGGLYDGYCFFPSLGEKVLLGQDTDAGPDL